MLHKSMFSCVEGEYMFLDFINKYFIQLSMACMWWNRALSCHSGFWMGGWCVGGGGALRLLKASSRSEASI